MTQKIETKKAPAAIGPYSQGIRAGGLLFVSGQIGADPLTGKMAEGIDAQTERVFDNIEAILTEAGMGLADVVKMEVFLTDLKLFEAMNRIYGKRFNGWVYPARACVEVSALPKGALVEIAAIAYQQ